MWAAMSSLIWGKVSRISPATMIAFGLMSNAADPSTYPIARAAPSKAASARSSSACTAARSSLRSCAPARSHRAGTDASVSTQPRFPHPHSASFPATVMCPSSPANPVAPPTRRKSETTQPPTPPDRRR